MQNNKSRFVIHFVPALMEKPFAAFIACMLLVNGGCSAHVSLPAPQTYLPIAEPGSPKKEIELSGTVWKKFPKKRPHIFSSREDPPPVSLYWIEKDTLLFVIQKGDDWKYSFLINTSNDEVMQLEDDEQKALRNTIENTLPSRKTGKNDIVEVGKVLIAAVFVATVLVLSQGRAAPSGGFGGSGGSGRSRRDPHYEGIIENNGYTLSLDARVQRIRHHFSPDEYDWVYNVKNEQTGRSAGGRCPVSDSNKEQEAFIRGWMRSWRISPDGRYYYIKKTSTVLDSETWKEYTASINEPYAAMDVSPAWDRLALLKMKTEEKTRRLKCWIEIYPFEYPNNKAAAEPRN